MARPNRPLGTHVLSIALTGLDAHLLHVEAEAVPRPGAFELTGLTEAQARECRVRVRASLQQLGVDLTSRGIQVQVGSGEQPKSASMDVAIAIAVLEVVGKIPSRAFQDTALLGELSLTGVLRPIRGVLPALRGAVTHGITRAIVPTANAREAASVPGVRVVVADHLNDLVRHVREGAPLASAGEPSPFPTMLSVGLPDLADIRGQHAARRALEIAAAGGHHLLLIGPPGAGKTVLSRRLAGILPPLTLEEALELTAVHSVAGLLPLDLGFIKTRPFRAPHHTVSAAGLGGGGDPVRPGEVSLAHHGVLFLDELLEFRSNVLETLREPLEKGCATICRARMRAIFPARPLLVAASNPCPCGFAGDRSRRCTCSVERRQAYRARFRGPLFDRFDVQVALPPVDVAQLHGCPRGEPSLDVQKRVLAARALQDERARHGATARINAQLSPRDLARFATPDAAGARVLGQAAENLGLSSATYERLLRVARTIADLDGAEIVRAPHIAEAVHTVLPAESDTATPG
jgi:magnesium chelatase family protein